MGSRFLSAANFRTAFSYLVPRKELSSHIFTRKDMFTPISSDIRIKCKSCELSDVRRYNPFNWKISVSPNGANHDIIVFSYAPTLDAEKIVHTNNNRFDSTLAHIARELESELFNTVLDKLETNNGYAVIEFPEGIKGWMITVLKRELPQYKISTDGNYICIRQIY